MIEETPPALAGRTCPLRYRYGPQAIAAAPEQSVATLYVIGGLYGNLPALDAIEAMAARRAGSGHTVLQRRLQLVQRR
jgi:hypothetical protein